MPIFLLYMEMAIDASKCNQLMVLVKGKIKSLVNKKYFFN